VTGYEHRTLSDGVGSVQLTSSLFGNMGSQPYWSFSWLP